MITNPKTFELIAQEMGTNSTHIYEVLFNGEMTLNHIQATLISWSVGLSILIGIIAFCIALYFLRDGCKAVGMGLITWIISLGLIAIILGIYVYPIMVDQAQLQEYFAIKHVASMYGLII
jgi:hypothetical protein